MTEAEIKVYPVNFDYKDQYYEILKRYDDLVEEKQILESQIEQMKNAIIDFSKADTVEAKHDTYQELMESLENNS